MQSIVGGATGPAAVTRPIPRDELKRIPFLRGRDLINGNTTLVERRFAVVIYEPSRSH